jgi:hypothetical protein
MELFYFQEAHTPYRISCLSRIEERAVEMLKVRGL